MAPSASALAPIDPNSVSASEEEKTVPWIVRKLVGSLTGRIVFSSLESLRAAGTTVVCLSPWGDSSPIFLPCIRFRDLVVHTAVAATGGTAAIAAPVLGPVADIFVSTIGDSIIVEIGAHASFKLATELGNDLLFEEPVKAITNHSRVLETTSVKEILITLKYKHTITDAALGFYRSSLHKDNTLFATVKDYLAVAKGWFSPYLFASGRRPIIPRTMSPDIVFCHGPFLSGDYKVGETLLKEAASVVIFASAPPSPPHPGDPTNDPTDATHESQKFSVARLQSLVVLPKLSPNSLARSRTPSPEPALAHVPSPIAPRRLVMLVVGLKPHRMLWTTSARPSESVMYYHLLNGCPAIVIPVKPGAPLLAWDTLTLEALWAVPLPEEGKPERSKKFDGIVGVLLEFLELCVDWDRVRRPKVTEEAEERVEMETEQSEEVKRGEIRNAVALLVAGAVKSGQSKKVRDDVDKDRAGIAMWRIP
ncbi:hypothetical protein K488DRAFT_78380 [Vararia minispora EC-137]|uniref:Uncharacterized protein n=1 Tax=Vararia minispora EC-137 TaxID=1314806 RepID=A0ACB8QLA0_9AGAM|nr:hypothetical protein K488DRAFT_78380 [Vararia minispora EC-137]